MRITTRQNYTITTRNYQARMKRTASDRLLEDVSPTKKPMLAEPAMDAAIKLHRCRECWSSRRRIERSYLASRPSFTENMRFSPRHSLVDVSTFLKSWLRRNLSDSSLLPMNPEALLRGVPCSVYNCQSTPLQFYLDWVKQLVDLLGEEGLACERARQPSDLRMFVGANGLA